MMFFQCFLVDFGHGALSYRKPLTLKTPKFQALWIEDPMPVHISFTQLMNVWFLKFTHNAFYVTFS